jgi:hypothetical protein
MKRQYLAIFYLSTLALLTNCYSTPVYTPPPLPEKIHTTPRTYAPFSERRYSYPRYEQEADNPYYPHNHYRKPQQYRYRHQEPWTQAPYSNRRYKQPYPIYDPSADNPYYPLYQKKPKKEKKRLFDTPLFTD